MAIEILRPGKSTTIEAAQALPFIGTCRRCDAKVRCLGSDCIGIEFASSVLLPSDPRFWASLACPECGKEMISMREERPAQ